MWGKLFRTIQLVAAITFVSAGLILVAFSLPFFGWKTLSVQSGSMEPAINTGALVFVKNTPAPELKKGQVVTYRSVVEPGKTITHRLVDIKKPSDGPTQYIMKGDANQTTDRPVYGDQMVGKVMFNVPFMGSAVDAMRTPLGLILLIYLPAALIAISEIRLLIRRLTQYEVDKRTKKDDQPVATEAPLPVGPQPELATAPSLMAYEEVKDKETPVKPAPVRRKRRRLNGLNMLAVLVLSAAAVGTTQALPTVTATLTGTTISAAGVVEPPSSDHIMIKRVDFPGAPTDKVSFQPLIYLYNPTPGNIVDMEGWTLESTSGQVFGFRGPTPIFPRNQFDVHPGPSGKLLIDGDFLVLKNEDGQIVDSLSWGTDTSQLSPAIQGIATQKNVKRVNTTADTNTAADWAIKPTPGQN
jgi:signal peptidase